MRDDDAGEDDVDDGDARGGARVSRVSRASPSLDASRQHQHHHQRHHHQPRHQYRGVRRRNGADAALASSDSENTPCVDASASALQLARDGQSVKTKVESGWTRPARKAGGPAGAHGSYSATTNVDGVHVFGFTTRVCSLDQWAVVFEDEEARRKHRPGRGALFDVHAARATTTRGLERAARRDCDCDCDCDCECAWRAIGCDAMRAFLNAQFLRSVEQGKLVQCFTSTGEAAWATFHTNLLSDDECPLFAVFFREFTRDGASNWSDDIDTADADVDDADDDAVLSHTKTPTPMWELCGFVDDITLRDPTQPWNQIEPILHVPPRATFVDDPCDALWLTEDVDGEDVALEIDARFWTSVHARVDAFPSAFANDHAARQRAASAAVPRAARLVLYGYRAPALRFARLEGARGPGTTQLLLPLEIDVDDGDGDCRTAMMSGAIVVDIVKSRRGGRMYRAVGVISSREAALTARVIGPITVEWLREAVFRTGAASIGDDDDRTNSDVDDHVGVIEDDAISPSTPDASPVSVIEHANAAPPAAAVDDVTKPAYAAVANTPAKRHEISTTPSMAPMKPLATLRFHHIIKPPPRCIATNPKVNLKMLPFEFMQAVTRKLRVDEDVLRLRDAPSNAEFRVIQSISVEASAWLRGVMSAYGVVDRAYVGVSRRVRCFFAVVSFEKWHDLETRDAMVRGEHVVVKEFKSRDRVYMRLSLEDKNALGI